MSDSVTYRVVKLPESLLTAVRKKRDQDETTNASFVAAAVEDHLPRLIEELQRIGFGVYAGDTRTARLPFSDDAAVLGQLKEGAETINLPATRLLELCLVAAVQPRFTPGMRIATEACRSFISGCVLFTLPSGAFRIRPGGSVRL